MDYDSITANKEFMALTVKTSQGLKKIARKYADELAKFGSFAHTWETIYLDTLDFLWEIWGTEDIKTEKKFYYKGRCYMRDLSRGEKARKIRERDYSRRTIGEQA